MFCETEAIIRELRKELSTKDDIVESLLSDNAELKEKKEELEMEVAELREQLGKVKFLDTPTTSPDVTSTEEVVVTLANVRSYEDGELEDEETAGVLKTKMEDMNREVEEVQKQNLKLNKEIAEKRVMVESSNKVIQAMSEETAALKERERQTSRDLLEFEKSLSELASEKENLGEKLSKAKERSSSKESEERSS